MFNRQPQNYVYQNNPDPRYCKKCRYCRQLIDKKASICPFCRKSQPLIPPLVCIAILTGIMMMCCCFYRPGSNKSDDIDNNTSETVTTSLNSDGEEDSTSNAIELTVGQKNALKAAKNYLDLMPFSAKKLVEQLEFEGYSHDDSIFAVSNCGADWNQQAAKSAKGYLDMMAFSKEKLIEQLIFDGFTQEQAEYGASAVGY